MTPQAAHDGPLGTRPISAGERSGVLNPSDLDRYGARWFAPDPAIGAVVETFWSVRWRLNPGEVISQRIIASPAVNLTVERGDVPAPLIVTGVYRRAWMRPISGSGEVFAIRLRPAGLAVLSDLSPDRITDATAPATADLDARLHGLLAALAGEHTPEDFVAAATRAIRALVLERPPTREGLLANAVLDELTDRLRTRAGPSLANSLGVSERQVQRALKATLGQGPKWVSRWVRLQEVARILSSTPDPDVAALAVDLGYTDQAHLVNDFRGAVGTTPGAYVRSLRELSAGSV